VLPPVVAPPHTCQYQYLLGKVSTIKDDILTDFERVVYQYLLGKVSTRGYIPALLDTGEVSISIR